METIAGFLHLAAYMMAVYSLPKIVELIFFSCWEKERREDYIRLKGKSSIDNNLMRKK